MEFTDYYSGPFTINKSGWNHFKAKGIREWVKGNPERIRVVGIMITKNSGPAWQGNLYLDDFKWQ